MKLNVYYLTIEQENDVRNITFTLLKPGDHVVEFDV